MTYASIGTFLSAPEQRSIFAIFEKMKIFGKHRSAAKIPSNRTNEIEEHIKRSHGNRHRRAHEKKFAPQTNVPHKIAENARCGVWREMRANTPKMREIGKISPKTPFFAYFASPQLYKIFILYSYVSD